MPLQSSVWDGRHNNFDFIRLALALLVIYSHSYPLGTGTEVSEPISRWTHGQATGGSLAVDLFFVISGFLITASAERSSSLWSFFKKRIARIYPAFIVAALVSATVFVPLASAHFERTTWSVRIVDFIVQTVQLKEFRYLGAFPHNPYPVAINGSIWSIPYEFWCYVGVALLLVAGLLRQRVLLLILFFASIIISVLFKVKGWIFGGKILGVIFGSPQLWARLLPLYLAGIVFYLFRDKIRLRHSFAIAAAAALIVGCWFFAGWTALFPIAGAYLVFYLAFVPWLRLHHFGRFGDFSYGTYLYAFPISQLLMKSFGHPVAPWLLFLCAAPLTLLVAVASWYGVERRFLKPARRKETILHAVES